MLKWTFWDYFKNTFQNSQVVLKDVGTPNAADVKATLSGAALSISGTGAMRDFTDGTVPWYGVISKISSLRTLDIESGVTNIGNWTFSYHPKITGALTIPASVTAIGENAFRGLHKFNVCNYSYFGYCNR